QDFVESCFDTVELAPLRLGGGLAHCFGAGGEFHAHGLGDDARFRTALRARKARHLPGEVGLKIGADARRAHPNSSCWRGCWGFLGELGRGRPSARNAASARSELLRPSPPSTWILPAPSSTRRPS